MASAGKDADPGNDPAGEGVAPGTGTAADVCSSGAIEPGLPMGVGRAGSPGGWTVGDAEGREGWAAAARGAGAPRSLAAGAVRAGSGFAGLRPAA